MCLQEFLNPFCEEVENALSQPNQVIQEIAGNLRLKHKNNVPFKLICWVFAHLSELNPPSESESEKHGSSRSWVSLYTGELEQTRYWEISASKTKTELPKRTVFNLCIQLMGLNWCVFAGVSKPFLWRTGKRISPAKSSNSRNSLKSPSKTQRERIMQTALLGVRSAKKVETAFRIREWEARVFQELGCFIHGWIGANAVLRNICF